MTAVTVECDEKSAGDKAVPSEDEHFNVVRHERAQVTVDKSQFHSQPGQRVLAPD
jgi:hypothetical protein